METKRLIDANRLMDEMKSLPMMSNWGEAFMPDLVKRQPTVDAVEIVRCKDCKYNREDSTFYSCKKNVMHYPNDPEYFCAYGKGK